MPASLIKPTKTPSRPGVVARYCGESFQPISPAGTMAY